MAQGKAAVIRSDLDIVIARTLARDTAKNMGFGAIDQARIATAVASWRAISSFMPALAPSPCEKSSALGVKGSRLSAKIRGLVL